MSTNMSKQIESVTAALGIPVRVVGVTDAAQVTKYQVKPLARTLASGRKGKMTYVSAIMTRALDISVGIGVENVTVSANGKLFIEVPKSTPQAVFTPARVYTNGESLPIMLGVDTHNQPVIFDLAKAPHLMIAGTTGSGKSVCLTNVLANLIKYRDANRVQLVLIDLKHTELAQFAKVEHLACDVVNTVEEAEVTLTWLLREIDHRYRVMQKQGAQDISEIASNRIVVVVDEFADLILQGGKRLKEKFIRVAQIGRAAGVHFIIATQRPSRQVVDGLIKANFPVRVCFRVTDRTNSRIVLDQNGAESLLGKGDGLLLNSKLTRFQGYMMPKEEVARVVKRNRKRGLLGRIWKRLSQ